MSFVNGPVRYSERSAAIPILMRPPSRPFMAIVKPWPSAPIKFSTGTRQSSKVMIRVGCEFQPTFFSFLPNDRPGVPFSTRMHEMPLGPAGASASSVINLGEREQ